jgi:hypothetical protein
MPAKKSSSANKVDTKKKALDGYVETGTVTGACRVARISRTTFYEWLKKDPKFAKQYEHAKEQVGDLLEEEALKRAYGGDHTLIIFLLKGLKPEKYGDKQALEHGGSVTIILPEGMDNA